MKKHYCTGLGPESPAINSCCQAHDNAYGIKGPKTGRRQADRDMHACFLRNGMSPARAFGCYLLVRALGWIPWYWHRRTIFRQEQ